MIEKQQIEARMKRLDEVNAKLADPKILKDMDTYQELVKERAHLAHFKEQYNQYLEIVDEIEEYEEYETSDDEELRSLAETELPILKKKLEKMENTLITLLIPPDPIDENNAILEIRAGTGGDEAALFAGDLFRMYSRYA
ncbi:MAG: PCRF domain-containing protein, partial [Thermotogota bacterium]